MAQMARSSGAAQPLEATRPRAQLPGVVMGAAPGVAPGVAAGLAAALAPKGGAGVVGGNLEMLAADGATQGDGAAAP